MPFLKLPMERADKRVTEQKNTVINMMGFINYLQIWFLGLFSNQISSAEKKRDFFKHLCNGKQLQSWGSI